MQCRGLYDNLEFGIAAFSNGCSAVVIRNAIKWPHFQCPNSALLISFQTLQTALCKGHKSSFLIADDAIATFFLCEFTILRFKVYLMDQTFTSEDPILQCGEQCVLNGCVVTYRYPTGIIVETKI